MAEGFDDLDIKDLDDTIQQFNFRQREYIKKEGV